MRRLLAGTGLVLVAAMTTACGGPPDDASQEDFCASIQASPGNDASQDDVDEWVEELEETGTPDNISDDEREGYEILVDLVGDIDADDTEKEMQEQLEDATDGDDEDKVEKFFAYVAKTCAGVPSD